MHPLERFGALISRDASLARYTAARLGGPADWLYHARVDERELVAVSQTAWDAGLDVRVLGKGANVLVAPGGVRGLVIINELQAIDNEELPNGNALIRASAGVSLGSLARYAQRKGIGGLEWLATVPGTVGGAVVNNAGAHGSDIASSLTHAEVLIRASGRRIFDLADMNYAYRNSRWKAADSRDFIVLWAEFLLPHDEKRAIESRIRALQQERKRTQPAGASLGSIFKNPEGDYAGRIIEAAGLKGARVGAVEVSPRHANFFINHGDEASAADYNAMIRRVQQRVREFCGHELELEIERIGAW